MKQRMTKSQGVIIAGMGQPVEASPEATEKKPTGKAAQELTPAIVARMQPDDDLGDLRCPGLRIRCGKSGVKTFFYRYKATSGALRQIKLGEFPPSGSMTLAVARKAWAEKKTEREKGVDPQGAKQDVKAEAKFKREKQKLLGYTVGKMLDDYIEGHIVPMRNTKGSDEVIRFLNSTDVEVIRKRPAVEVTRNEAFNLITKIRNRGVPVLAGQIKSEIKAAYEFAMNAGVIDMAGNPFAFTLKGLVAAKRERTLNNAELVALVPWIRREYSDTVADALLITLYCGVRSGEVCTVEAHEINDGQEGMVWVVPASKSKTKVSFKVMVPSTAAEILRKRIVTHPSGWLFPARDETKHIQQKILGVEVWVHTPNCPHPRYANKSKCPVGAWAPHDLRRTCRTKLSELRCPVEVAEAILNHVKGGVRGKYDLYKFDAEKREWLQRWDDYVNALLVAENVLPFGHSRAA